MSLINRLETFYVEEFRDKYSRSGYGPYKNPMKNVIYHSNEPSGDVLIGYTKALSDSRKIHTDGSYRIVIEGGDIHIYGDKCQCKHCCYEHS